VILPVVVEKSKDVVIDAISARWVHKGSSHGASSASDLTEAAFKNVRGSDRLPVFFGEVIIGETFTEILGQALDGCRLFDVSVLFPDFEAMDGVRKLRRWFCIHPSEPSGSASWSRKR
jgi:hypothetical protein